MTESKEVVAFGGGCFWCTEAVFLQLKGIAEVTPGYAGGSVANPSYEHVSDGTTGHAEVIRIAYDPSIISFAKLLEVFFASHDPTTLNRQGADTGTQYRSTILYTTPEQKTEAERMIAALTAEKKYADPIVTKIEALNNSFYPAEEYHKRYYDTHPDQPYVEIVIAPKVEKIRHAYKDLLKDQ